MHPSHTILSLCVAFFCNSFPVGSSDPLETDKSFFWLSHDSEKIVGGTQCNPSYQVSLQSSRGSHFCGGSIVSKNCVLSAAHCTSGSSPSSIKVKCGAHSLNSPDMQSYSVSAITVHPQYNSNTIDNDIAILRLGNEIQFTSSAGKVDLPQNSSDVPAEGEQVKTSGYGTTSEGGSSSGKCMCVNVPMVSQQSCNSAYNNKITDGMICAGTAGKDSCQGDSGGPLVKDNTLVGIVSWGKGCARDGYPGVYANVAYYHSWILETAAAMGCDLSS